MISLILALPALYYTFIYNPFFIFNNTVANTVNETLRYNFSNKFVIISTIIFFHLFQFLIKININYLKSNYVTNYRYIILLLFIYFFTLFYFDFSPDYGGGGFFYKLSNILKNDYLFFIIYFISLIFIFLIVNKNLNNFIFFIIFVLMNPQLSIYHRYYDPLIILSFLLFFDKGAFLKDMIDKKMIYIIFIYTLFFNILYILKNYI